MIFHVIPGKMSMFPSISAFSFVVLKAYLFLKITKIIMNIHFKYLIHYSIKEKDRLTNTTETEKERKKKK